MKYNYFMRRNGLRIALYTDYVDSDYVQKIHEGAWKFCKEKNVELIEFPAGEINSKTSHNYQLLSVASHIKNANVDGLIFLSATQLYHTTPDSLHTYINSFSPLPTVSLGYTFPNIPSVMSDSTKGLTAVITHIIQNHNCRRIALMGVSGNFTDAQERTKIYKSVLEKNHIPVDESIILYGSFTYQSALLALNEYYEKNKKIDFDSIVALNDNMAFACIDFLRKKNFRVPEDVIVTGFDDVARANITVPSLTTVNQDIEGQGYAAAEMVFEIINKKNVPMIKTINSKAVFRCSCGCSSKVKNTGIE